MRSRTAERVREARSVGDESQRRAARALVTAITIDLPQIARHALRANGSPDSQNRYAGSSGPRGGSLGDEHGLSPWPCSVPRTRKCNNSAMLDPLADVRGVLAELADDELEVLFATSWLRPAPCMALLAWIEHAAD